jgi:hypothetical protein
MALNLYDNRRHPSPPPPPSGRPHIILLNIFITCILWEWRRELEGACDGVRRYPGRPGVPVRSAGRTPGFAACFLAAQVSQCVISL